MFCPITTRYGHNYDCTWSGPRRGSAALWAGDPNGPSFLAAEFIVHDDADGPWVEWSWPKGQSRWRPDRDEDELDYVPKPEAEMCDALEGLILHSPVTRRRI